MKKIIILLFSIFLITGCEATYNLEIGNKIKEEINIPIPSNISSEKLKELKRNIDTLSPIIDDFDKEFNYTKEETSAKTKLTYEYSGNYHENIISNQCFENFEFEETDEYVYIKGSGYFGCLYDADKITFNVKTAMYVSNHNGTQNEDIYSWEINKSNRNDSNLEIMINKKIYVEEKSMMDVFKKGFTAFMILAMIIGGIYLYLNMNKKENSQ